MREITILYDVCHSLVGISSEPGKLRPAGTVWLKRDGSWRCPREYQRRQSEESRTTTLTSASKMMRVTRQPWGTIVPPTFELGHQKLPLKKIDNVVSRLYYVPKPKPLLGLEAQRRHSDLDKDTIDELVGIVHQYGLVSLQNTVTVMTFHVLPKQSQSSS